MMRICQSILFFLSFLITAAVKSSYALNHINNVATSYATLPDLIFNYIIDFYLEYSHN